MTLWLSARPDKGSGGTSLVNLGVLLSDRAAGTSRVWPDAQGESAPLRAWALRGTEAIGAGHGCEFEVQPVTVKRAGDNEPFPYFVDCVHSAILPRAGARADHTRTLVRVRQRLGPRANPRLIGLAAAQASNAPHKPIDLPTQPPRFGSRFTRAMIMLRGLYSDKGVSVPSGYLK